MQSFLSKVFILFLMSYSNTLSASNWYWGGYEIIGLKNFSRSEILQQIPIKLKDVYKEDNVLWDTWCRQIKEKFSFYYVRCSSVRYSDFKAFFVIDIIEKRSDRKLFFLKEPKDSIDFPSEKVMHLYEDLQNILWDNFNKGTPSGEFNKDAYLDYEDPRMSKIVSELIVLVPPIKDKLIHILKKDHSAQKRATAATLLNWAKDPQYVGERIFSSIRDPHHLVRNNISRFFLHYYNMIHSKELLKNILSQYKYQLQFTSHGDRNKAVMGIYFLLKNHPDLSKYVFNLMGADIKKLSEESILSNVGQIAKEIVLMIHPK